MSPTGDITIYKSQLFRTCGAPTAADRIRNPGYRPTYSYGLARPISMNSLMQACSFMAAVRDFHSKLFKKSVSHRHLKTGDTLFFLSQRHIQYHHESKAHGKTNGSDVAVFALTGLGDQFFDYHIEHGSGSKGKKPGQDRREKV